MDDLIDLVRRYQTAHSLDDRLRLGGDIIGRVAPDIRLFLFGAVPPDAVSDLSQETLVAVAKGLGQFRGNTAKAFFGWCYGIARHKVGDFFRLRAASERVTPMEPDELANLLSDAAASGNISAEDRLDLDEALWMLGTSKPDCRQFLWNHYVLGFDYHEIAGSHGISYDAARVRIGRYLDLAQSLIAQH